jgi:hypothetical protein
MKLDGTFSVFAVRKGDEDLAPSPLMTRVLLCEYLAGRQDSAAFEIFFPSESVLQPSSYLPRDPKILVHCDIG